MISGRSEFTRIASNYLRIAATFLIGIFVVRILVGLGEQTFNIFAVVALGAGIGVMLKELLFTAIVPPLTRAFTEDSHAKRFDEVYATCFVASLATAVLGCALMTALYASLQWLEISLEFLPSARAFVIFRAVQMAMSVFLAPMLNMLVVSQRQAQANVLLTAERFAELAGAISAITLAPQANGIPLVWFGAVTASCLALIYLAAAIHIRRIDPAFAPKLSAARREKLRDIVPFMGWSAVTVFAMGLHYRFNVFLVNVFFGSFGTLIMGVSIQVSGYVRQMTMGLVRGLESVFAHLYFSSDQVPGLTKWQVLQLSTILQGLMVFFTFGFLWITIDDLLYLWLGPALRDAEIVIPLMSSVALVLTLGMSVRSLTEGWMALMTGAGELKAFAPWILLGGCLNPLIVAAVFWISWPSTEIVYVAWVFTMLHVVIHGIIIAIVTSRLLAVTVRSLIEPFLFPALMASVVTALAFAGEHFISFETRLLRLAFTGTVFTIGAIISLLYLPAALGSASWKNYLVRHRIN